ncbi:hypothetical protein G6L37_03110 [Agrobacterium rubi]|nr:hypothetical protein [Agrobacterium rubi]NTF24364.1 hypothetical protein [Agrobacterium rubi]
MEATEARSKSRCAGLLVVLVPIALAAALKFINPFAIIAQDWSLAFTQQVQSLLPFYFAACVALGVLLVFASLKWFPEFVALVTVAATILALSGTLVPLKIFRDEQARQARIAEADLLADRILGLAALSRESLPDAARAEIRKIAVSMFGEQMLGPDYLKPMAKNEVGR